MEKHTENAGAGHGGFVTPGRTKARKAGKKRYVFTVKPGEQRRYERIRKLLEALASYSDRRASVLLDLSDDKTLNDGPWPLVKQAGLPLSASMRTDQLMRRAAEREGNPGGKIDREMRDYLILPLREVGIVQQSFVVPEKEVSAFDDEIVVYGFHRTKSGNNAYVLSDAAKELLEVDEVEWDEALAEFVASDPNRRLRRLQQRASAKVQAATGAAGKHAALIEAAVDALLQSRCKHFDLVFMDDADGNRIREDWLTKLEALDLMPDLSSRWPDAILVKGQEVWFVDAVTTDGEIDEVRKQDLERWVVEKGFTVAGHTTAYEDWKRAGARQSTMKNLAVGSTFWIAEDGGKLFVVEPLV